MSLFYDSENKMSNNNNCICLCGLKFPSRSEKKSPNFLENWKLWLEERRKIHEKLTGKLHRKAGNLLMNCGDELRHFVVEEKILLDYARIQTEFDKFRGNPNFFKLPESLRDKNPPFKGTEYFKTETKAEKNVIPEIELIGIPDYIIQEKQLGSKTRNICQLWRKSGYKKARFNELAQKLCEIQPHKPDFSNLIVLGTNKLEINPEKCISSPKFKEISETSTKSAFHDSGQPKLALKINRKQFTERFMYAAKNVEEKISLIFEYFLNQTVPETQQIKLENYGSVTLRITFTEYKKLRIFREFTEKSVIESPFRFNKELILLPGESKKLPIWFRSSNLGNYCEFWEICTTPKIWPPEFRFLVEMRGFVLLQNYEHKVHQLREKLRQKARNSSIKEFLNDVIEQGNFCQPSSHSVTFKFSQQEQFESANFEGNSKKIKYQFNKQVVKELEEFYEEIRQKTDPKTWDLKVRTLIELARKKDLENYFQAKLLQYKTAKIRRISLKESAEKKSGGKKAETSSETKKKKSGKTAAENLPQRLEITKIPTYYEKLRIVLRKFEAPSIQTNKNRLKHFLCALTVKTFFNRVINQLEFTQNDELPHIIEELPQSVQKTRKFFTPEWLKFEIFNESYILHSKRIPHIFGAAKAKRKPTFLHGIPQDDAKKIFRLYFNKKDGAAPSAEKKPKAENRKKPAGNKEKKTVTNKEDENLLLKLIEDFDPFAAEEEESKLVEETISAKIVEKRAFFEEREINEENYLKVYVNLCHAVDLLVDTVEALKETEIIQNTELKEILKCKKKVSAQILSKISLSIEEIGAESRTQSQTDYFNFLKEIHYQNNIEKYFFDQSDEKNRPEMENNSEKVFGKVSVENLFSMENYTRKPEPSGLKDASGQTENGKLEEIDLITSENEIFNKKDVILSSTTTTSSSSSSLSKNMFYFMEK